MKLLALPNAHALAHVSRLLEIAKVLRARGHEIVFAGHGKYLPVAGWDGFETRELVYMPVEQVVRAVRSGRLWEIYREDQLEQFVRAELALYEAENPDLLLLDNRPSARASAEKAGLACAAVVNVHLTPYRRLPFFSPGNTLGEHFPGVALADRLENASENFFYDRLVMGGLARLRKRLGLPRRYGYENEEGDISLLADIPEFSPVRVLPAHARYVGPLTWRNTLPPPACLDRLDPAKPTVYLSLGSEGLEDLLGHLGTLAAEGVQIVVALGAAGADPGMAVPPGVFLERYVNTDALLPHCTLVCCHGGNGTLYQALAHGLPCVVVATHQEQYYGGKRIRALGLGEALTLKQVKARGLGVVVAALRRVLTDPGYHERARAFAGHFARWRGGEAGADAVEALARDR
ncbi:MAG: nucleotide disphospho-sugar-binding domain-containing protein [Planctomycetota bacterium]